MVVVHHLSNSRSQHVPLLLKLVFDRIKTAAMPLFAEPIAKAISDKAKSSFIMPQLNTRLDDLAAELGKSTWFVGDEFTAVGVQLSFPIDSAAAHGGLNASHPRLMDHLQRIHAQPAYQRAIERGDKDELMR